MKKFFYFFLFFVFNIILLESFELEHVLRLINSGNYDEAIKILQSNDGQNDILLSIAYLGKKDFSQAKSFVLKVYQQNDILSNYILALISEEEKDYSTALRCWENVLRNVKDNALKQLAKKHINVIKKIMR